MVMRSKSINYPFFVSPDLIDDVSLATPHSWNKYAYVRGRPIGAIDPMGLEWQLVCTGSDAWCDTPASGYFWGIGDGGGGYHPGPCVTEWVNGDPKQVCGDSIAYITTVNLPNSNDVQQSGPGMGIPGTRVQIAEKVLACLDAIISASPTGVAARDVPVYENSAFPRMFGRDAMTLPVPSVSGPAAGVFLAGSAEDFVKYSNQVVEEYWHVLAQWDAGRLTLTGYAKDAVLDFVTNGFTVAGAEGANKYENEARAVADALAPLLQKCMQESQ